MPDLRDMMSVEEATVSWQPIVWGGEVPVIPSFYQGYESMPEYPTFNQPTHGTPFPEQFLEMRQSEEQLYWAWSPYWGWYLFKV